jgi:acyl-CoA dehydrogenase
VGLAKLERTVDQEIYERYSNTYTIFEGTSEIQRLIIARAISGVHIR